MRGVFYEMEKEGFPSEAIGSFRDAFDCNIYFFDNKIDTSVMYLVVGCTVVLLLGVYIALNTLKKREK